MQFLAEKQRFQFYDSPIKRPLIRVTLSTSTGFQFYDSPIKRSTREQCYPILYRRFNSMIVRLKALVRDV